MNKKERAEVMDGQIKNFFGTPKSIQRCVFEYVTNVNWRKKYPTFVDDLDLYMRCCKSPIELSLAIAYAQRLLIKKKNRYLFHLFPQYDITAGGHLYYADFLYDSKKFIDASSERTEYKLVIECDGHDYHHTTKEQVRKDYEREMNLKLAGYDVLRFTGSQIYENPFKCAETIINYISEKVGDSNV